MDKVKMTPPDGVTENMEKLAALFPAAVTEMRGEDGTLRKGIDFEKLRQLLSRDIVKGGERYEFSWVGKKAAMAEAARPTTETLRPVKADSRNWDTTENLYIEGDNLAALKILQESYLGKVKMIYIDPPYNTGNDFIYADDFMRTQDEENEQMGMFDEDENHLFKNTDGNGRFHSDWCSMIYSRLMLARNLLTDDGAIFISIDDNEIENLKKCCTEIFGEDNFVGQWNWYKSATPPNLSKKIKKNIEYILCYEKHRSSNKFKGIKKESPSSNGLLNQTNKFSRLIFPQNIIETTLPDGPIRAGSYGTSNYKINLLKDALVKEGRFISEVILESNFKWSQPNLLNEISKGTRIYIKTSSLSPSYEKSEYDPEVPPNFIDKSVFVDTTEQAGKVLSLLFDGTKVFDYPKPIALIKYLCNFICNPTDIILDFFSGSATTAHAVMQLNAEDGGHRKFIMVQLPEPCDEKSEAYKAGYKNICEIGKERIRRAGNKIKAEHPDADLDIGFRVFRVDSSNMRDVYYKPEEFTQTMLGEAVSNIKPDRTDLDLLYACLLDCGVPIHLPHTTTTVDGCTIHNVDNGALMACFDEHIPHSVIRAMAAEAPLQVIFRDSAFAADADKINVTEIFKNLSPDTKVRVI